MGGKIVLKETGDSKVSVLLRWTGNGSFRDLVTTASRVLRSNGPAGAKVVTIGDSIAIQGIRAVSEAWTLKSLPGVEWVAFGRSTEPNSGSVTEALLAIAKNYVVKGSTFRVIVEAQNDPATESDFAVAASSRLLDEFRGTKIHERKPKISFHIAVDASVAVVGVEVFPGVGGAPTSRRRRASCLVSGGIHSSVVAWMAVRAGYSVSLLHVFESDAAFREIANLYAELSMRIDPTDLRLDVLLPEKSSNLDGVLLSWIRGARSRVLFSGAHAECRNASLVPSSRVASPLFLSSEEEFQTVIRSLGLRGHTRELRSPKAVRALSSRFRVRSFGGVRADAQVVLDALLS